MSAKHTLIFLTTSYAILATAGNQALAETEYSSRYNAIEKLRRATVRAEEAVNRFEDSLTIRTERATSPFGWRGRTFPFSGFRFGAPSDGTMMRSIGQGRVSYTGYLCGFANSAIIDYNSGLKTIYPGLATLLVHTGETVEQNQEIGLCTKKTKFHEVTSVQRETSDFEKVSGKQGFGAMLHPAIPYDMLILKGTPEHGQLGGI